MSELEFSVPFNNDLETLEELIALKEHNGSTIREVYLNAPQTITGSGRVGEPVDEKAFLRTIDRIHEAGIRCDMTMNSTCDGAEWYSPATVKRIVEFVQALHEERRVEAITLANPFYIEQIRRVCPLIEISASVLADIDCYSKAKAYVKAGANTITADVNANHDLAMLQRLTEDFDVEIKLMVNEGCLAHCPYRKFHMNYISHKSRDSATEEANFSFACGDITDNDPSQIFKSGWVRPEDLKRYGSITKFFKIVGRDMLKSKVIRCVRAYMEQSYDGNLLDLLCSNIGYYGIEKSAYVDNKALGEVSFFERVSACNRRCETCSYCEELANRFLKYGWVTRQNLEDLGEYALIELIMSQFKGRYPVCKNLSSKPSAEGLSSSASKKRTYKRRVMPDTMPDKEHQG